ncbi:MAG: hypothetical protein A2148_04310 [Chloroflexi bacterium RBG_16_68_14]|nr:MAG: hypothetical protein A2148_04310 [Chloroflexi bacterium RBG_16_68_14]
MGKRVSSALVLALALFFAGAGHALADHETRNRVLRETPIDALFVGVAIGGAVLALVLFGAAMLWWERQDKGEG